jgi:hypothetical protein
MDTGAVSKLAALRKKTDRDLLILVGKELDRALALANVAATRGSPLYTRAEKIYQAARGLLPRIPDVGREERRKLDARLRELRAALDGVPAHAGQRHIASAAGD